MSNHSAFVVAGLVPATTIILLRALKFGAAGTSPAATPVGDSSPVPVSIPNLVRFGGPFGKRDVGVRRAQQHTRNLARGRRQRHFAIDELIVEADRRRLLAGVREIESAKSRPVDGAKAHRARLATRIDLAIRQMESAELRTGATDSDDFGVGGRVAGRGDLVPTFRHDDAIAHDHGSEWPTLVGAHAFQREVDSALHEIFAGHTVLSVNNGSLGGRRALPPTG